MRVDSIRIRNFRCFGDSNSDGWGLLFRPQPKTNLIVGPNGAGKTAILDALDLVLNADGRSNRALVSEYDFHNCITNTAIGIEVRLTDVDAVLADFSSDIQWIDPSDGCLTEESGVEVDPKQHRRALVIRFEASTSNLSGEIEWGWFFPKFEATEVEPRKELSRTQHELLGLHRIRPAVSAGAFTLSRYSPLGRHLRKLEYRLAKLPGKLGGEHKPAECQLLHLSCEDCDLREACLPGAASNADSQDSSTLGSLLGEIAVQAETLLGANSWHEMLPALGPRYGGSSSRLAGMTLGLRPSGNPSQFIPFEYLSAGEKYALSFALAKTQVPGDVTPVIIMEEPETALYPSGVITLVREIQAAPSGSAHQIFLSSHSETVLRCAHPMDVQIVGHSHQVNNLQETLEKLKSPSNDALSRPQNLLIPGGLNVLLADKVLVVEGAQDAIVAGLLDRLAAEVTASQGGAHSSLASRGWTVYPADKADSIPHVAQILLSLAKKVAVLLDADSAGKAAAEKTKALCSTFTFKSRAFGEVALEEALLAGLSNAARSSVLDSYRGLLECASCSKSGVNCWVEKGDEACGNRIDRKRRLQVLCLDEYSSSSCFPRAFAELIKVVDSAHLGAVHELDADA